MSNRCYIPKKFSPASEHIIEHANRIIAEWQKQGYTLTLRQLYYQFVAADLIPNTEASYKRIGSIIGDGRLAGRVPWDALTDRTRTKRQVPTYASMESFWKAMIPQYAVNHWKDQDVYLEVWVEKEALSEIVQHACGPFYAPFLACKGYLSASAMYQASLRYEEAIREDKECHLIYLGDHDPSGIDMTRDITARIELLTSQTRECGCISNNLEETGEPLDGFVCDACYNWHGFGIDREIRVHRVALEQSQIRLYSPPPNPAKVTDSRAKEYIKKYGNESWELDALSPSVISDIVTDNIEDLIDLDVWEDHMKAEKAAIKKFKKTVRTMKF